MHIETQGIKPESFYKYFNHLYSYSYEQKKNHIIDTNDYKGKAVSLTLDLNVFNKLSICTL